LEDMRTFLELLPFAIEQAISTRWMRVRRTRHSRRLSAVGWWAPHGKTGERSRGSTSDAEAGKRRFFVDLAVISNHDAGTGIQRVVRAIALALLDCAPEGGTSWDIRFVSAKRKRPYHCIAWPDIACSVAPDEMRARPGDVFLGLDYSLDTIRRNRRQLAQFRRDGGALWFLVHDLLPLNRTEWFSRNTVIRYRAWFGIVACLADGFLCNSFQTETELKDALDQRHGRVDRYHTQILPMGHAIFKGEGNPAGRATPSRLGPSTTFALMVGTLEPRKGHAEVLAAFDLLWLSGSSETLVLIGRLGWHVDALRELILTHPEHGARLLWFDDVEDPELMQFYEACTGVIIASHGEGFGLPLIEALGCGKPVLARDLPVFREHEGKGVHFFPANAESHQLAVETRHWLEAARRGLIRVTRPSSDWGDAALTVLAAIEPK
jgi:glycosyltransferase involved in cell wall biosynthesis